MMNWIKTIFLHLTMSSLRVETLAATSNFYLSFRRSGTLLREEWAAFRDPMPELKEFSICHWDKPIYFNDQINSIWNYCIRTEDMDMIDCFALEKYLLPSTANQQMEVVTYFDYRTNSEKGEPILGYHEFKADTKPYQHRKWQHYCWLYSSISCESYLYWNGNLMPMEQGRS